jgi:DNA-binding MarR family transcriptional regulator
MLIDEFDYLEMEAYSDAPIISLSSLISKIYEEIVSEKTEDQFLNQRATRFVLAILAKKQGLSQNDIVRVSHMKGSTISVTVAKLEEKGMVKRIPDSYDQRCLRVYLTDAGRELNDKREKILTDLEALGKKDLAPREITQAITVLKNYLEQLLKRKK